MQRVETWISLQAKSHGEDCVDSEGGSSKARCRTAVQAALTNVAVDLGFIKERAGSERRDSRRVGDAYARDSIPTYWRAVR